MNWWTNVWDLLVVCQTWLSCSWHGEKMWDIGDSSGPASWSREKAKQMTSSVFVCWVPPACYHPIEMPFRWEKMFENPPTHNKIVKIHFSLQWTLLAQLDESNRLNRKWSEKRRVPFLLSRLVWWQSCSYSWREKSEEPRVTQPDNATRRVISIIDAPFHLHLQKGQSRRAQEFQNS